MRPTNGPTLKDHKGALSIDARFDSVEQIAERSWSNHEIAEAVRDLRKSFRELYSLLARRAGNYTAKPEGSPPWPPMRQLIERPPSPPTYLGDEP